MDSISRLSSSFLRLVALSLIHISTLINLFEDKIVCADCGRKLYFHRKRVDKRKDGAWYAFYAVSYTHLSSLSLISIRLMFVPIAAESCTTS